MDVTVVLPCLDEEQAVGLCVHQALDALAAGGLSGEVIVVDNGSTDSSVELAMAAGARVIEEPRRGYGRALRTGFEHASSTCVVMGDADGTYDFSKIPELVAPVLAGEADMVLATRLDGANSETMPFLHRWLGTPVITFLTSRAAGRKLTKDSQTGFRGFDRLKIESLGLAGDGMELASEMLIKAARHDLRIHNIEGGYSPRIGESKLDTWSDGWRHLMLILQLAPNLLLIGPGIIVTLLGVLGLILAFVQPDGVEVGSAQWQPVFFSGIALVLGVQAYLSGSILASYSPLTADSHRGSRFVRHPSFPNLSFMAGVASIIIGLAIDVGLLVVWTRDADISPTTGLRFGFATLAQSLIILGGTLVVIGMLARFLIPQALSDAEKTVS